MNKDVGAQVSRSAIAPPGNVIDITRRLALRLAVQTPDIAEVAGYMRQVRERLLAADDQLARSVDVAHRVIEEGEQQGRRNAALLDELDQALALIAPLTGEAPDGARP